MPVRPRPSRDESIKLSSLLTQERLKNSGVVKATKSAGQDADLDALNEALQSSSLKASRRSVSKRSVSKTIVKKLTAF